MKSLLSLSFGVASGLAAGGATLTVTTTADSGPGSLRQAITDANTNANADVVQFDIPGGGVQTMMPASALPSITAPLSIDGFTQPGTTAPTHPYGFDPVLLIEISGLSAGGGAVAGLHLQAANCLVRGLVINRFSGPGILLENAGGSVIEGNFIGTDTTGTNAAPNLAEGVKLLDSPNNTIGNPTDRLRRNVISGNASHGVYITGPAATNNIVEGNLVGLDSSSERTIPNAGDGVAVAGGGLNRIGVSGGIRNYIGGNLQNGVRISGTGNNSIHGQVIGTDPTYTRRLGNGYHGVRIDNSPGNYCSYDSVVGNAGHGVYCTGPGSTGNTVDGCVVGPSSGQQSVATFGNGQDGVRFEDAPGNRIVSFTTIAGNGGNGVSIIGSPNTEVRTTIVGTSFYSDRVPLGNGGHGILVQDSADVLLGTPQWGYENIICANGGDGIRLAGSPTRGCQLFGNIVGTDETATFRLGNTNHGLAIVDAAANTIGGQNERRNVIAFNGGGVVVQGAGATNNAIRFTRIFGATAVPGIDLEPAGGTANDLGDADAGPNQLQNFPVLTSVSVSGAGLAIEGNLSSRENISYTLDFYASFTCHNSTNGEGERYIGSTSVMTESSGAVSFSAAFPIVPPGTRYLTATATDPAGNTSEFSPCVSVGIPAAPAPLVVITTDDSGPGSLREAIQAANADTIPDRITFAIPGGGVRTITLSSPLPDIVAPVVLDGYSQAGSRPFVGTADLPARLNIELNGEGAGLNAAGLTLRADSCLVRGLVINRFTADGIVIASGRHNLIEGNFIGTDAAGKAGLGNRHGVVLTHAPFNVIGGSEALGQRNLLSGNAGHGLLITGWGSSNNVVNGNHIGTDTSGNSALGNGGDGAAIEGASFNILFGSGGSRSYGLFSGNRQNGVRIEGGSNNFVGGIFGRDFYAGLASPNGLDGVLITNAAGNTVGWAQIHFHAGHGVHIVGAGSIGNWVQHSTIGAIPFLPTWGNQGDGVRITDAPTNHVTANALLGNGGSGVALLQAPGTHVWGNYIGNYAPGNTNHGVLVQDSAGVLIDARNYISGNRGDGIRLTGAGTRACQVRGNFIGTDVAGTGRVGNTNAGVAIIDAPDNVIGSTNDLGQRNVISANGGHGVLISGAGAFGNVVNGNYLGLDDTGTNALGNVGDGVAIEGAALNRIGLLYAGAFNVISGNGQNGVRIHGAASNYVQANAIGLDHATARRAVPNGGDGVRLEGAAGNLIGGPALAAGNWISGNARHGVCVTNSVGNVVGYNLIGLSGSGTLAVGNGGNGVRLENAPGNSVGYVGGIADGAVIAGNLSHGVHILGSPGAVVRGNKIGTDASSTLALGNQGYGVAISDSTGVQVGALPDYPGYGNVIGHNRDGGILLAGGTTRDCLVLGNSIGTDETGMRDLGNLHGITVLAAANNTIGGTLPWARNIIAFNDGFGLSVADASATNNAILRNAIFANTVLGIDLGANNVSLDDVEDGDAGPNLLQNFPILSRASNSGSGLVIQGTLNSRPNTVYTLEFYANPECHPSGHGEGRDYAGSATVNTDGSGNAAFDLTFAPAPPGTRYVTATATDPAGNTSEFSPCAAAAAGALTATYTVNSTADSGPGSVRQAILDANLSSGPDRIVFNIPGLGPHTISPVSPLPNITDPVLIDGYTQPGAKVSGCFMAPAELKIELNGAAAGEDTIGLALLASNCRVQGLAINRFSVSGLLLTGGGHRIEGNHIGTDVTGTLGLGNGEFGVWVENATFNTIGGNDSCGQRNVISGNGRHGVYLVGLFTSNNVVAGNYIGTDAFGTNAVGNVGDGVAVEGAPFNTIGPIGLLQGSVSSQNYNTIAGNLRHGVRIENASGNTVGANQIGAAVGVIRALSNAGDGILLANAPTNNVGANNVCCSGGNGIRISGPGATGNVVQANASGAFGPDYPAGYGNHLDGLRVENAAASFILENIVRGNQGNGIAVVQAPNTRLALNQVGHFNSEKVGNGQHGILLQDSADVLIDTRNVILANGRDGVHLTGPGTRGVLLRGNLIGADSGGTSGLGNAGSGVAIADGAWGNSIGTNAVGLSNVIAFNGQGVIITSEAATNNAVLGNSIYANTGLGIDLGKDGVTPNDAGDLDGSPNHLQNFPVLTAASSGSNTVVLGTLNSAPNTTFRLEFFASVAADPTGHGEGQIFLGSTNVTTAANGNASLTFRTSLFVAPGQFISATATDPAGNTSEFSLALRVAGALVVAAQGRGTVTQTPAQLAYAFGQAVTLTVTDGRYYRFVGWSDGDSNAVRVVTVGETNVFVALFTNTVALETLVLKQWERVYGGTGDDGAQGVLATPDGGLLVGAYSLSGISGNKTLPNRGNYETWLLRLDASGNKLWERNYGGTNKEVLYTMVPTGDGGYLLAGTVGAYGTNDYWIVRINALGDVLWERTFGGSAEDVLWWADATPDGGFVLVGGSNSEPSGNKTAPAFGAGDWWVVKVDAQGTKVWDRSYGGTGPDVAYAVKAVGDGSLLVAGASSSGISSTKTEAGFGGDDVWALKLGAAGDILWQRVFGAEFPDQSFAIQSTGDGGFVLGAQSVAGTGGNRSAPGYGGSDYWLIRLGADGTKLWDRAFGGSAGDYCPTVLLRSDGGFVLSGVTYSGVSGNKAAAHYGGSDLWLVGSDPAGNRIWDFELGGARDESLFGFLAPTPDGGLVLAGGSASPPSGNKQLPNFGSNDVWVVKLAAVEVPVGTAVILVNGMFYPDNTTVVSNAALVEIVTTFPAGSVFYTLDGSAPGVGHGTLYTGPFVVAATTTIRAVAFGAGFTPAAAADPFELFVIGAPAIVQGPLGQTVNLGAEVAFEVVAVGAAPLEFQWFFNGAVLVNATNTVLGLINVQAAQAGHYTVGVSNALGQVFSPPAALNVLRPVSLLSGPPLSTNVALGSNVTFCVNVSGTEPLQYQWQLNGAYIPGATNACLTLTNVQPSQGGLYGVLVANAAGAISGPTVTLSVEVPAGQPLDNNYFTNRVAISNLAGILFGTNSTANLELGEPRHDGKPHSKSVWYQWHAPSNGVATFDTQGSAFDTVLGVYTGATVSNLTRQASDDDSGGFYASRVRFGAVAGTEYQVAVAGYGEAGGRFLLRWQLEPSEGIVPRIVQGPSSVAAQRGGSATFQVVAEPAGVTYQWVFEGTNLPGATNASLIVSNVVSEQLGRYSVRLSHPSNPGLSLETAPGYLEIGRVPTVVTSDKLEELQVRIDSGVGGSGGPAGGTIVTRLGSLGGQEIQSKDFGTQSSEPLHCAVLTGGATAMWWVPVTSAGILVVDTVGSGINTLMALYPTADPWSVAPVQCDVDTNTFGCRIEHRVSPGDYVVVVDRIGPAVVVTNVDGTVNRAGTIQLNWQLGWPPVISSRSTDQLLGQGSSLVLSVQATNRTEETNLTHRMAPPRYQWSHNGRALAGMTNGTLVVDQVQSTNAGEYRVEVSNAIGSTAAVMRVEVALTSAATPVVELGEKTDLVAPATERYCASTYQWLHDGMPVGSAVRTLELASTQLTQAGQYSVVVSNCLGQLTNVVATVGVAGRFEVSVCDGPPVGATRFAPTTVAACEVVVEAIDDLPLALTDLGAWRPVLTNSTLSPLGCVSLPEAVPPPKRFYRARLVPCR